MSKDVSYALFPVQQNKTIDVFAAARAGVICFPKGKLQISN